MHQITGHKHNNLAKIAKPAKGKTISFPVFPWRPLRENCLPLPLLHIRGTIIV